MLSSAEKSCGSKCEPNDTGKCGKPTRMTWDRFLRNSECDIPSQAKENHNCAMTGTNETVIGRDGLGDHNKNDESLMAFSNFHAL